MVKYKIIYRIETGILQQSGNQSNKQFTGQTEVLGKWL